MKETSMVKEQASLRKDVDAVAAYISKNGVLIVPEEDESPAKFKLLKLLKPAEGDLEEFYTIEWFPGTDRFPGRLISPDSGQEQNLSEEERDNLVEPLRRAFELQKGDFYSEAFGPVHDALDETSSK